MRKKSVNHRLGSILQQIYKIDVALEPDHSSKKQLLLSFLKNFKDYCSQKSALFVKYFQHFYLTGSYFEGLRVKEATEFDVNVAFDFPFSELNYMVSELDVLPSYATIQLKSSKDCENIPFFDTDQYLVKKNILQWFQSLLDSFINSHVMQYSGVLWMKSSNSGPARTVKILYRSEWISIDLVPVFSLNVRQLKKVADFGDCLQASEDATTTSYIVPKPLKPELSEHLPSHLSERLWRIHFPEAEKSIIKDKKNLKRVIKLVKALRDKEDWPIPSYFLKVVAFWLVKRNLKNFWDKKDIGSLFLLFLEALEKHLAAEFLGHIFYPRFNLFHSLHSTLLRNLQIRVKKIIQQLKNEPESAFMLFKIMYIPYSSLAPSLLNY